MKSKKMDRTILKSGYTMGELCLLKVFIKLPWKEFTISEVKKISKVKSHHYVHGAMKKFSKSRILIEKKIGRTNTYCMNTAGKGGIGWLSFVELLIHNERDDIPYSALSAVIGKIRSPFYSLIICGSYAEKKQKPASDLDVAVIVPDSSNKKPFETALLEGELTIPEIHGFVFTAEEFYSMLVNDEFNYGKEMARKHIIVCGAEAYYSILFEAMKNGFKG